MHMEARPAGAGSHMHRRLQADTETHAPVLTTSRPDRLTQVYASPPFSLRNGEERNGLTVCGVKSGGERL